MSKKKSLLDLYRSILKTADMVVSDDGYVSVVIGDETKPAMVKGKRLVLPTPDHLKNSDWSDRVVFHPLSENILRGESQVLEMFRNVLNIKMNTVIGTLAYQLLTIATSTGEHSKLTPDQSEFLSYVKNADEKTIQILEKLMMAMPANQHQKAFVSIYLKRSGTIAGKRHSRVGVVTFPLYEELTKGTGEVYGVKLRKLDREALIKLLEFMIPGIEKAESHNRGSDSTVAPYLDALMKAVMAVAGPINDIVTLFENQLEDSATMMFEADWVESFENLAAMVPEINTIPMQAGNDGAPAKTAQPAAPAPAATPSAPAPAPAQAGPLPAWMMNNTAPPPISANPASGYYNPNVGWAPPAGQQPPSTGVVKTQNGADFDSILRNNPALAAAPTPGYPQPQQAGWGGAPARASFGNPAPAPYGAPAYGGYNTFGGGGRI